MPFTVVVVRDGAGKEATAEGIAFIGRAPDNHIVLDSGEVSRHHARIEEMETGHFRLVDLGSANGTRINGQPLRARAPAVIGPTDVVTVGPFTLRIEVSNGRPSSLHGLVMPIEGVLRSEALHPRLSVETGERVREFELTGPVIVLGRGPDNDIVIDQQVVSLRHAILRRLGSGYQIEDLGSANGLHFGRDRISSRLLEDGDIVTIGRAVSLRFHTAPATRAAALEGA